MTNGGGTTEAKKAERLSERLGVPLTEKHMLLSHTPMKTLVENHRDDVVLSVGKAGALEVLESYGFKNVVTADQFHSLHPSLFSDVKPVALGDMDEEEKEHVEKFRGKPVSAIMCVMDPLLWSRDLQIMCDVLRSDGTPGNVVSNQQVPLYLSCPDFEYVTEFPIPRFGSGVFDIVLKHLYGELTGRELQATVFGKPHKASYEYAEGMLAEQVRGEEREEEESSY